VDVDENPELAREYQVTSIPCLVVYKGGGEVKRFVGVTPKARLTDGAPCGGRSRLTFAGPARPPHASRHSRSAFFAR
jgi:hypothetical protein